MNRYLIVDGNNLVHRANNTKPLTVGNTQVQAVFGFLRILRSICAKYQNATPLILWDGASWRNMRFPDYKKNREKNDTKAAIKQREAHANGQKQMPLIKKGLELLGIAQIKAANMEADDLAAIFADRYAKRGDVCVLISSDKDWVQLAGPKVLWFDPVNDRKIQKPEDIEKALGYALENFDQFLEMKCLTGDLGDNIPGVGGIGEKGAIEFFNTYGSVANFSNMLLDGSLDPKTLPAKFRKFAEDEDKRIIYQRNLELMDLRTSERPAPLNLTVNKGTPDITRFRTYCDRMMFKSITQHLENWVSVFPSFHYLHEELAA